MPTATTGETIDLSEAGDEERAVSGAPSPQGRSGRTGTQPPPPAGPEPGTRRLAIVLSAVAGFVDGVGATILTGVFVSFMSGNTTSTGIGLGSGKWSMVLHAGTPIVLYVIGIVLGALLMDRRQATRAPVLLLAAVLLAAFAPFRLLAGGAAYWAFAVSAALLVLPMALVATTLRSVASASVGLGYVTGTLVSLGEAVADAFRGRGGIARIVLYGSLWLCFFLGAALGTAAAALVAAWSVLLPAAVLLIVLLDPSTRRAGSVVDL